MTEPQHGTPLPANVPAPALTPGSAPAPGPDRDPGLQPERTALAWQRTGLAASMVCLVTALTAFRLSVPIVGGVAGLCAIALILIALRRFPRGAVHAPASHHPWPALVRIALGVAAVAALGITIAVVGALAG